MILQVDKTKNVPKGAPTVLQSDFIEDVVRTTYVDGGVKLHLSDGTVITLENDSAGNMTLYNYLDEYKDYTIVQAWLLNKDGKTLKRLI
ncbi:hypothetical protein [Enterococcus phage vB_Efs25_KEN11]|uniref:Uncharacterized protein n=1 Tax=Enterococcus phage vB_Efs6_KEN16 TaxID=3138325 RepID=A0AAX4PRT8_9CAUD